MKSKIPSSSVPSALSVVSEILLKPCDLPGNWHLGFETSRKTLNENQITSIL